RKNENDLASMSPVWCFLGGDGGPAVLGLLPRPEPMNVGGEPYYAILVPFAPVPFGGTLLYVPAKWVVPADMRVENLISTYVSMGVSSPNEVRRAARLAAEQPDKARDVVTPPAPTFRENRTPELRPTGRVAPGASG